MKCLGESDCALNEDTEHLEACLQGWKLYQHLISKQTFVSTLQDFLLNEALDCDGVQALFDGFVRDVTSKTSTAVTELVRHKPCLLLSFRRNR